MLEARRVRFVAAERWAEVAQQRGAWSAFRRGAAMHEPEPRNLRASPSIGEDDGRESLGSLVDDNVGEHVPLTPGAMV